jgi:YesN/AraC family two-component response regulator
MIGTNETDMLAQTKRKHMAGLILCEISGQYFYPQTCKHNHRFLDILGWLQTHYAEAFSLDEISLRFQYNKVYLCRLFHNKTGETMYAYVTRLRMEKALTLLADTTDTIKEIARQVGYSDEKQFIRNFRLYNKMTATQYRLQCVGKPFEKEKSE